MMSVFARTREKEKAWKFGIYCLAGAAVLSVPVTAAFMKGPEVTYTIDGKQQSHRLYEHKFGFFEVPYSLSIFETTANMYIV